MRTLTKNHFKEYKKDYDFFGTHTEYDKYNNEKTVVDSVKRCTVNTMFQPLQDEASIAEYGEAIKTMYTCILYGDAPISHGDIVHIRGNAYEVVSIKFFNTYIRVDVKKKEA